MSFIAGISRLATRLPIHPVVFAATIVISAWLDAAVSPFAATRSLLVAVGLAVVITVAGWVATRSAAAGGLLASAIVIGLWSRMPIAAAGEAIERMGPIVAIAWLGLVVVTAALVIARLRRRVTASAASSTLDRASSLLLIATLALGLLDGRLPALLEDVRQGGDVGNLEPSTGSRLPDIYTILLDGYPRADVLEFAFDIDNDGFLGALEARGFDVADRASSAYLWTHVSLPATLNMAYVEEIPIMRSVMEGDVPRQPALRRAAADGMALRTAQAYGYTTVAIASGFEEVALRQADAYLDGGQLNEFEVSLLTSTFAADLMRPLAPDFGSAQLRSRIRYNLALLPAVSERSDQSALFVVAHIPSPHQPVVFGADGVPVADPLVPKWFADSPAERGQDPAEFRERYRAQLPVINDLVLDAIDGIIASSDEPPVIVLFADHGSASVVDWNETDPEEADPARLLERTGILFAALTPDHTNVFPDDVSNVDLFRLLFDAYLGTDYGPATPPTDGGHVPPIDASVLDGP